MPIVVATHADGRAPGAARDGRACATRPKRGSSRTAPASTLLTRRAAGGFPIKLLNYMEASRAIVARASIADPLVHDRSGWLVADDAPPAAWAEAVDALVADPARAARLGAEAHRTLLREHDPAALALRLLAALR